MGRHWRDVSNNSTGRNLPADTNWKVELSVLERSQYYSVLSDIIDSIHEKSNMPTTLLDQNGLANMSMEFTSGDHLNFSLNISGIYNESVENLSSVSNYHRIPEKPLNTEHYVLIVMYTLTTLLAILGNSLAIVIFTKGKRSKTDLRPFLINLAIADLIMAIFCIPFTFTYQLLDNWIFSRPMCPIVMFLQTVSVTGSVSTNMAIGIDRFCAVAFPLNTSRNSRFRYRLIILVIWIISIAFAGVQLFVGDTQLSPDHNLIRCIEKWENPDMELVYTIFLLILTYLVPVIILTVTYSIVGYLLWKRNLPGNADIQRDQAQLKAKLKIMKMLITIVVLFALCWLPIHIFFLVLNFGSPVQSKTLNTIYFICHWIAMSNSFVNPIVYGFLNDSFRADLKALLHRTFSFDKSKRTVRHGAVKFKTARFGNNYHTSPALTGCTGYLDVNSHTPRTSMSRTETVTTSFLRL